ncbi:hypothetical protein C8R44DRAFT_861959, partial [Mycena epipterygia]
MNGSIFGFSLAVGVCAPATCLTARWSAWCATVRYILQVWATNESALKPRPLTQLFDVAGIGIHFDSILGTLCAYSGGNYQRLQFSRSRFEAIVFGLHAILQPKKGKHLVALLAEKDQEINRLKLSLQTNIARLAKLALDALDAIDSLQAIHAAKLAVNECLRETVARYLDAIKIAEMMRDDLRDVFVKLAERIEAEKDGFKSWSRIRIPRLLDAPDPTKEPAPQAFSASSTPIARPSSPSPDADTDPDPGTGRRGSKFNADSIAAVFVLSTRGRSRIRSRQDDSPPCAYKFRVGVGFAFKSKSRTAHCERISQCLGRKRSHRDENPDDVHTTPPAHAADTEDASTALNRGIIALGSQIDAFQLELGMLLQIWDEGASSNAIQVGPSQITAPGVQVDERTRDAANFCQRYKKGPSGRLLASLSYPPSQVEHEQGRAKVEGQTDKHLSKSIVFEATGGNTLLALYPLEWIDSVVDHNNWRVIEQTDLRPLADVLSEIPRWAHVRQLLVQAIPAYSRYIHILRHRTLTFHLKVSIDEESISRIAQKKVQSYLAHDPQKIVWPVRSGLVPAGNASNSSYNSSPATSPPTSPPTMTVYRNQQGVFLPAMTSNEGPSFSRILNTKDARDGDAIMDGEVPFPRFEYTTSNGMVQDPRTFRPSDRGPHLDKERLFICMCDEG